MLELKRIHEEYETHFGEILGGEIRSGLRGGRVVAAVCGDREHWEIFEHSRGDLAEGLVGSGEVRVARIGWCARGAIAHVRGRGDGKESEKRGRDCAEPGKGGRGSECG